MLILMMNILILLQQLLLPIGIVPRALQMIKSKYPDVIISTDIALDPYSSEVAMIIL